MIGGAWEDTDKTHRPRKSTTNSPRVPSCDDDDQLTQDETNFYTEVDLADLQMKLRRWTFARNWKTASSSSSPRAEQETDLSPLSRPIIHLDKSPTYSSKKDDRPPLSASSQTDTDNNETPLAHRPHQQTATPPLDEDLMAQYLNRCIAAAETQLAGARDKSKVKNGAVKEIERLVEKVVRQAELGE